MSKLGRGIVQGWEYVSYIDLRDETITNASQFMEAVDRFRMTHAEQIDWVRLSRKQENCLKQECYTYHSYHSHVIGSLQQFMGFNVLVNDGPYGDTANCDLDCRILADLLPHPLERIRVAVRKTIVKYGYELGPDYVSSCILDLHRRWNGAGTLANEWGQEPYSEQPQWLCSFYEFLGAGLEYALNEDMARKMAAGLQMFHGDGLEWECRPLVPGFSVYYVWAEAPDIGPFSCYNLESFRTTLWLLSGLNRENTDATYSLIISWSGLAERLGTVQRV